MNTIPLPLRSRWAIAAAALVAAGAGAWALAHEAHAASPPGGKDGREAAPVAITSAIARRQDMPVYRTGIGTVQAAHSVTVRARVDGQLDSVGFAEGQDVRKGQVVARIDPRTYQAALLQAQAARAKDQATLANARVDLRRYQQLIAQDAATQQQLDTQQALVAQLEAQVRSDDAQVNTAQVQLGYTTITAPIAGRAGTRLVDPGNIVHAADATGLVVINQIDPISVLFTLPEDAVQDTNRALAGGRRLPVQAYSRDGSELLGAGTLTAVNNQIDTASGTVQMKASFPNPQHALWPGQYVDVRLVLGTRAQVVTVPAQAIQRGPDRSYVYTVDAGGAAASRTVAGVQIQDGVAIVGSGLQGGERVVVDGQYRIRPGSRVTEVADAAPAVRGAGK
ncbi:MAG TPA: efflux RND transporter periplasmic adaptor subunit [Burkholderiaceae bacterium]